MKKGILFFLFLTLAFGTKAQDLTWWDELHNYPDAAGINRIRYQNISPGFMGPNALRLVPLINGKIDNEFWFLAAGDIHRGSGDKTENVYLEVNIPLAKNRVLIYVNSIPYEHYEVTSEVRDLRRMVNFSGEGSTTGDVQVGTVFRVFVEDSVGFNMTTRIHLKTTTGADLENARYSNHGMYVFDTQFSKTLMKKEDRSFLIKAMVGFMTWQTNKNRLTNGSRFLQNDAPVLGLGFEYQLRALSLATDLSGYYGYIGNRDTPFFSRTQVQYRLGDFGLMSEINIGFQSWAWNTARFGVRYFFGEAQ